jgi:hypothetical protein
MSKQITEVPMKKGYKCGGTAKKGYVRGGKVESGPPKRKYAKVSKIDQSMCSPRKQMAMGNG